jgi:hypothetical protein
MGTEYDVQGLESVDGFPFPVFVSPGGAARGRAVAQRAAQTIAWLDQAVGVAKTPPLFVLGPDDWNRVAAIPLYGMPHVDSTRIVIGQQPAAFWHNLTSLIAPHLRSADLQRLTDVYGEPPNLGSFADLLVSHELSHLAHGGSWPDSPLLFWLKELAANLGLQGYVSEVEPEEAARLETIFEVTWAAGASHWPVRDLDRMADSLEGDGSNYVWFEFGLQVLAKRLWQTAGVAALERVMTALRGPELTFGQVVDLMVELDAGVAQAIRDWPTSLDVTRSS